MGALVGSFYIFNLTLCHFINQDKLELFSVYRRTYTCEAYVYRSDLLWSFVTTSVVRPTFFFVLWVYRLLSSSSEWNLNHEKYSQRESKTARQTAIYLRKQYLCHLAVRAGTKHEVYLFVNLCTTQSNATASETNWRKWANKWRPEQIFCAGWRFRNWNNSLLTHCCRVHRHSPFTIFAHLRRREWDRQREKNGTSKTTVWRLWVRATSSSHSSNNNSDEISWRNASVNVSHSMRMNARKVSTNYVCQNIRSHYLYGIVSLSCSSLMRKWIGCASSFIRK